MLWVYIQSETAAETGCGFPLYTVGHYTPAGKFEPESDYGGPTGREQAAQRVAMLNGETLNENAPAMLDALQRVANVCDTARSVLWRTDRGEALRFAADSRYVRAVIDRATGGPR